MVMKADSLFDLLDLDQDGRLSRSGLLGAAKRLGWHWHEAPLLALLDLLTLREPISRRQFAAILHQIQTDPLGPYGEVLLHSPHFSKKTRREIEKLQPPGSAPAGGAGKDRQRRPAAGEIDNDLLTILENSAGKAVANQYQRLRNDLAAPEISADDAALLVIDPQRAFTEGVWMQSIGAGAADDVKPITVAFKNCAAMLAGLYGRMEIMFTRCPFPPGSYDWDNGLAGIIDSRQLYFIKPGNSVLFPPFNGFREWTNRCIEQGRKTLVIGGCTLNSCVRVSAIETLREFKSVDLRIVVDLSICGARLRNYRPSDFYDGTSAAASAVSQMTAAGVQVVRRVEWE